MTWFSHRLLENGDRRLLEDNTNFRLLESRNPKTVTLEVLSRQRGLTLEDRSTALSLPPETSEEE